VNPQFQLFKKKITNPLGLRLFMLNNLPSAYFAGIRIESFNEEQAIISVKQKWFNKNPFQSIYFGILSMAAEVSTCIICMSSIYKRTPPVSMLIVKSEGLFYKKATGKISFICTDCMTVNNAAEAAIATNEGKGVICHSIGRNYKDEMVAEFYFTWSLKPKLNNKFISKL
jgi:hypothetical protein